jgi:hypothetical protein
MAIDAALRTTEKNLVFSLLNEFGFDPADFEWSEIEREEFVQRRHSRTFRVSVLKHRRSQYYMIFGGVHVVISPGITRKVDGEEHLGQWGFKENYCRIWLNELRKEVDAPDLWASVGQERMLSNAASSTSENQPFNPSERNTIAAQLHELKRYLLAGHQFQAEQAEFIEGQFKYLKEASERLGRKDWLNVALSGFVGLIVELALDPDKAKGLLAMAGTLFQWIWSGTQGLIQ